MSKFENIECQEDVVERSFTVVRGEIQARDKLGLAVMD